MLTRKITDLQVSNVITLFFKLIIWWFQIKVVLLQQITYKLRFGVMEGMRRSKILEERRRRVTPEVRDSVALSFRIVDRIHDILVEKGLKQKDLAQRLGKSEAEISKWMRGTHNFTIDTLVSIEDALEAPIVQVYRPDVYSINEFEPEFAAES